MPVHYFLFVLFLLPYLSGAQSTETGFGEYRIGVTKPDSLPADFIEQNQPYVKGTIALPCAHIRTFAAARATLAGVPLTNLTLFFYDNTLFRLSGDYSDQLKRIIEQQYGPGQHLSTRRSVLCASEKGRPLLSWGEAWTETDLRVVVIHQKGYSADCQPTEGARLIIASQRLSALSSECDLQPADSFAEAFADLLNR